MSTLHKLIADLPQDLRNKLFFVGGFLRDALMQNREGKPLVANTDDIHGDIDMACQLPPETMLLAFESLGYKAIPTGLKHGTITVVLENIDLQVTSFRTETTYSDFRRPDQTTFNVTLLDDLQRRDFTVNSMALPVLASLEPSWSNKVVDPFNAKQDIKDLLIRAVGDPDLRFSEDALRMLRACRFIAQYNFNLDPMTQGALTNNAPLIAQIAKERITEEMNKLLLAPFAVKAIGILGSTNLLGHLLGENRYRMEPINLTLPIHIEGLDEAPTLACRWYLFYAWLDVHAKLHGKSLSEQEFINCFVFPKLIIRFFQNMKQMKASDLYSFNDPIFIRRQLIQLKKLDMDPLAYVKLRHCLTVISRETPLCDWLTLRNQWQKQISLSIPNSVEKIKLSPQEIIQMGKREPGAWVSQCQDHLLESVIQDPTRNTPEFLASIAMEYLKRST